MVIEHPVVYGLDLTGTAAFAFSGLLRGMQRRPDFVRATILAGATALGGGLVRDLVLHRQVAMLADMNYLLTILAVVIVAFFCPDLLLRREKLFRYVDAFGLGVFSAIGAGLAWDGGFNPLSIIVIACITGAGGGIIRDVLLVEMPLVLYREIYITAVAIGAAVLILMRWAGASYSVGFLAAMIVTMAVRMLAIRFDWGLPRLERKRKT